ncbi:colicin-like pore-forming protein [Cronobacter turicensis]|nr:hypothetical protein [Cronobacter turicensis]
MGGIENSNQGPGWNDHDTPHGPTHSYDGDHDSSAPGGGEHGHSGDHDHSGSGSSSSDVEHTPWGDIVTKADGHSYMNGLMMTEENSQLVDISPTHAMRVLNSLLDRSFMKPEPGEHAGVTGVPATAPNRRALAENALANAQAKAKNAADNQIKTNTNINQAQKRLDNAKAKIAGLKANVTTRQQAYDEAHAVAIKLGPHLNDIGGPLHHDALRAGYYAGVAKEELNDAQKALVKGQAEISSAQKALDDAKKALPVANTNKQKADSAVAAAADMKDAINATTTFFEGVTKKFGERAARLAQELAAQARSAKIRNVAEAIALFEKHKGTALAHLDAADKAAIVKAFESLDQEAIANQLKAYSKVFGRFNKLMDLSDLGAAIKKGIETGDWKDTITKLESLALTNTAGELVAIAFAAAGSPLGIVGFGLALTLAGIFFGDEKVLSAINSALGM